MDDCLTVNGLRHDRQISHNKTLVYILTNNCLSPEMGHAYSKVDPKSDTGVCDENNIPISNERLPCHLQEPSWMDFKREFYFGTHGSIWRIRFWNAVFWVIGMAFIVFLFLGGMIGSVYTVYIGTLICWLSSCIFKETSLTATCLVGTVLSIWQGGDILSKYWRVQMGNVSS